jgi:hypothetical protein
MFPEKCLEKYRFFRNFISQKSGLSSLTFDVTSHRLTTRGGVARNQADRPTEWLHQSSALLI